MPGSLRCDEVVPEVRRRSLEGPYADPVRRPDLTVVAIPAFIGAMAAEYAWQRRHPAAPGGARAGDYELADTVASLTMGVGSLVAPFVTGPLVRRLAPGSRWGTALLATGAVAGAVTTVGDVLCRRRERG